jgi:prepilin-type processing-associated H-X9-DG protein
MFLCMLLPGIQRERRHTHRLLCGKNLSEIGKAMITYANDYGDVLPVAGGRGTIWGPRLNDWKGESRGDAFAVGSNGTGTQATISASLYLLVRHEGLSPELFVCPKEKGTTALRPAKWGIAAERLDSTWDFGPDPARHCSYAYNLPYSRYKLTTSSEPHMAVAADRNPWIDGPRQKAGDFSLFIPDLTSFKGTSEEAIQGNTQAHRTRIHQHGGQNVLYLDGHVGFEKRAFCGFEDDNIYTSWGGSDKARGVPPKPYRSQPASELDSLLVNDPPLGP